MIDRQFVLTIRPIICSADLTCEVIHTENDVSVSHLLTPLFTGVDVGLSSEAIPSLPDLSLAHDRENDNPQPIGEYLG